VEKTQEVLAYFRSSLLESDLLDYVSGSAQKAFDNKIDLRLYDDVGKDPSLSPSDLAEVISLSSHALDLGNITINNYEVPIRARYPEQSLASKADITALPVPFAGSLVPLRALVEMKTSKQAPELVRINGENAFQLEGYFTEKEKLRESELMTSLARQVAEFKETTLDGLSKEVSLHLVDAKIELTTALRELSWAILISIVLIFLVLLLQFASVVHSLIIMLAIPFGILGVLISLFVFNSTLSLNSALGVILLVGITVANSIMLVEKFLRLLHAGLAPEQAILETARQRIRPILMTSLITILGMLPIALGYGEGGKVLQPLGIAICGGLWVSLVFTLYIIPALELAYVGRDKAR
jgi:multidrug efflux pump subunit AcrB